MASGPGVDWKVGIVDPTTGGTPLIPVNLNNTLDNTNDSIDVPLHTSNFLAALTVTTGSPYAPGNTMGGALTFATAVRGAGLGAVVDTVTIYDKAKQNSPIDVYFYNIATASTTFTDKVALAMNAADLTCIAGHVSVLASHYSSFSANSIATVPNVGIRLKPSPGTAVFMILVCRGTPTFASASDISVAVSVRQD